MSEPDDDEPLTLVEACKLIFRNTITPATLRLEAGRGKLTIERIGRRDFVTRRAIKEMRRQCEVAPPARDRDSGSSQGANAMDASSSLSGSSGMDHINAARDAARLKLRKLSESWQTTSPKNTNQRGARQTPAKSL